MSIELDDGLLADPLPYLYYRDLREDAPALLARRPDGVETWLVTRYEDAKAVLADRRFSTDLRHATAGADEAPVSATMVTSDPPDHTRLRRLVSKGFTPRRVEELRHRIGEIANQLVDEIAPMGEADLIDAFAFPLPVIVICELLGVPVEDRHTFRRWTADMLMMAVTEERVVVAQDATRRLHGYLAQLVQRKRDEILTAPEDRQPDLISALIVARDQTDRLSERELVAMITLLLFAGHETTVNLIGNGMASLFLNPEQLDRLREQPELLGSAVEELLRFEAPVQQPAHRVALEDITVGGVVIPAGAIVSVVIGSANRDPRRFADPDRLDVTRDASQHLSFGYGIHHCLGAPLARMEGRIAFGTLLERLPDLSLACPPEELRWKSGSIHRRGLTALPVRFTPT
jgi:cytochrome P450